MSNNITRPRNVGIGATAAPLLIVGALILLNGAADPRSSAADVQAPQDLDTIIRPPMGKITESQRAAIEFREQIPALAESDSPFPLSEGRADDDGLDLFEIDPDVMDQLEFMVTAVMASNAGNIALINGKAHREGDELGGGWVITKIDATAKHVVLNDANGEMLTIGLHRSGSQFPGR